MIQYLIAIISISGFLLVFILKPDVETYIKYTLWTLPVMDTKLLPSQYGFIKVFDVLAFFAFIFLMNQFLTVRNVKANLSYFILTLFFICFSLISKYFSEFPYEKMYMLYPMFSLFIFTRFFIHYLYEDFSRRYELFSILKRVFFVFIGFMVIQFCIGTNFTYYPQVHSNALGESFSSTRFPGLFQDSQTNGQFLAMASFLFLLFKPGIENKKKIKNYISFIIISICIILAGSRSALGGFLVGIILLFLFVPARIKIIALSFTLLTISLIVIIKPNSSIFQRSENLVDDYSFRESIWTETINIIEDHPMLGIGPGNYEMYIKNYKQDLNLELQPGEYYYFHQPENGYLKIIVEHGIIASLFLFVLILITLIKSIFQFVNQEKINEEKLIICSTISFLIAFNTVYSFIDYRITCLFGILISLVILYSNFKLSYS